MATGKNENTGILSVDGFTWNGAKFKSVGVSSEKLANLSKKSKATGTNKLVIIKNLY